MNRSNQCALGYLSALVLYPISERLEKRYIRNKRAELRAYFGRTFEARKQIMRNRLADIVDFSGTNVPYYKDLFRSLSFDPKVLRKDSAYLQELPYLTKDIVREQGRRLLSRELDGLRHYDMKTGGSTGLAANFFYDQVAADYSAAVTLYSRERIGKRKHQFELHFACRFPYLVESKKWTREDWKELAMNRSNIFFDRLDEIGLEEIWQTLVIRRPFLIHGHPSTIYALACHIQKTRRKANTFEIFESSGELLKAYQRELIEEALQCKVVDRYGLAEFGIIAYELNGPGTGLQILDSEGWPESLVDHDLYGQTHEFVFSGFRNLLMPLIRYRTGDMAKVVEGDGGFYLSDVIGRTHDLVPINNIPYPTHYIMDVLNHRVGGIQEFQIDLHQSKPILLIVPETNALVKDIHEKIISYWGDAFELRFVQHDGLVRVGRHQKFRHLVHS